MMMISLSQIYQETKRVKKESAGNKGTKENKGGTEDVDGNNEISLLEVKVPEPEIVSLIDDSD